MSSTPSATSSDTAMTTPGAELGDYLRSLVRDEDAAQQYLLDPEAALNAAGLSRVTPAEIHSAADILGLPGAAVRPPDATAEVEFDVTEVIRTVLQHSYIGGFGYRNILSSDDIGQEFDAVMEPLDALMEPLKEVRR
jgi:hypothetical protein